MLHITSICMPILNFAVYIVSRQFDYTGLLALSTIYSVHSTIATPSAPLVVNTIIHMDGPLDIHKHQNEMDWLHHFLIWWVQLPNPTGLSEWICPSEFVQVGTMQFFWPWERFVHCWTDLSHDSDTYYWLELLHIGCVFVQVRTIQLFKSNLNNKNKANWFYRLVSGWPWILFWSDKTQIGCDFIRLTFQ